MTTITNDVGFRNALEALDLQQQRALGARFIGSVLSLSEDSRLARVLEVAQQPGSSEEEMMAAFKSAKSASIDSHTRCGADGDWSSQAGYFVARAATAVVAPEGQVKAGGPAWQAAMNSRMARTCQTIGGGDESRATDESTEQYRVLERFLDDKL